MSFKNLLCTHLIVGAQLGGAIVALVILLLLRGTEGKKELIYVFF